MSGHAGSFKTPPYAVHSEKLVLHGLVRDPALLDAVRAILPAADVFFRPEHARLYATLIDDDAARPDPGHALALLGALPASADEQVSADTVLQHAAIVAEKANMRKLIDAVSDMIHDAYHSDDGFETILRRARKSLDALRPARKKTASKKKSAKKKSARKTPPTKDG